MTLETFTRHWTRVVTNQHRCAIEVVALINIGIARRWITQQSIAVDDEIKTAYTLNTPSESRLLVRSTIIG